MLELVSGCLPVYTRTTDFTLEAYNWRQLETPVNPTCKNKVTPQTVTSFRVTFRREQVPLFNSVRGPRDPTSYTRTVLSDPVHGVLNPSLVDVNLGPRLRAGQKLELFREIRQNNSMKNHNTVTTIIRFHPTVKNSVTFSGYLMGLGKEVRKSLSLRSTNSHFEGQKRKIRSYINKLT